MDPATVKTVQAKWVDKLPALRFGACWALLTAAVLLFLVPVAAIAYQIKGPAALPAAGVAAGVCWLGSTMALAGTAVFGRSGMNGPLYTLAFGLAFNCGLPFVVGLALHRSGGALAQAGVFGLIVVFFQYVLVVSTLLSLCLIKPARSPD
jgi:hypothetical protein